MRLKDNVLIEWLDICITSHGVLQVLDFKRKIIQLCCTSVNKRDHFLNQ